MSLYETFIKWTSLSKVPIQAIMYCRTYADDSDLSLTQKHIGIQLAAKLFNFSDFYHIVSHKQAPETNPAKVLIVIGWLDGRVNH